MNIMNIKTIIENGLIFQIICKEQNAIDKIYLYAKDLSEAKYKLLIQKRKNVVIKCFNDPSAFVEHSNTMDDMYNNVVDYNPKRKGKKKFLMI